MTGSSRNQKFRKVCTWLPVYCINTISPLSERVLTAECIKSITSKSLFCSKMSYCFMAHAYKCWFINVLLAFYCSKLFLYLVFHLIREEFQHSRLQQEVHWDWKKQVFLTITNVLTLFITSPDFTLYLLTIYKKRKQKSCIATCFLVCIVLVNKWDFNWLSLN